MFSKTRMKNRLVIPVLVILGFVLCAPSTARPDEPELQVGLARAKITPEKPIRMAGYASRNKPSDGVLADLYAKAMAFEDGRSERAVLLTADVIGFNAKVADFVCGRIMAKTALQRHQILETRCLYTEPGFFPPEVEGVVLAKVRRMAEKAGRALPE